MYRGKIRVRLEKDEINDNSCQRGWIVSPGKGEISHWIGEEEV